MNIALFAKITTESSFFEQVNFMLLCFLLVIGVLAILSLVTSLLGIFFKSLDSKQAAAKAAKPACACANMPVATVAADDSARIAAIISAAVYAVLEGAPHRIVSVKPAAPDLNWASSGRNAIFASKNNIKK